MSLLQKPVSTPYENEHRRPWLERNVIRNCLFDLHELCHFGGIPKRLRTNDIGFARSAARTKVLPRLRRSPR